MFDAKVSLHISKGLSSYRRTGVTVPTMTDASEEEKILLKYEGNDDGRL